MQYYAAAAITNLAPRPLHMTLAFMGAGHANWTQIETELSSLPFPFEISFDRIIQVGEKQDIEAVQVSCVDLAVEKAIRRFHYRHVDPSHISANNLMLHITAKGHAAILMDAKTYTVRELYVRAVGGGSVKDDAVIRISLPSEHE